ncbi:cupin domain-containing protein [Siccirubricoccus sp. KC 17139]|uniref:Cupin domain-containing protein n=1 Tax=Siccirubricoccus soli TaxID=2899147 RepID=A0ABT1D1W4_9PROT|nr:cupin domain-containing protein [Siccirubricoccus soli]MCO6415607.1 cupin domain-containing protein [Siccirubricoccus soli]MCP2681739.1 cupin domain-containing protein [Siccirubricoccus soli]
MDPETLLLPDDGVVPNNPRLPALLWRAALPPGEPEAAEACFAAHGWPPAWRNGIHPYHHYHPNAHEALAIARGRVRVQLGGEQGQVLELQAGDVVALPAGVGHRNLGASDDLLVVGAYPAGQEPEEYHAEKRLHDAAIAAITATPDPPCEPLTGKSWPDLEG